MGRYTGPSCRLCRQVGEKLFLKGDRCNTPKCAVEKRKKGPGSQKVSRRRPSDYAVRLHEKQKVRYAYGLREHQMLRNIRQAQKQSGATGDLLIQLLERRLDNVIFRLNFADSRKQGRQLVLHGHFTVNGRKVDVPSFVVRPGDEIAWKETSLAKDFIDVVRQGLSKRTIPDWLVQNSDGLTAKVSKLPDVASTGTSVDTRLIVEFYSR